MGIFVGVSWNCYRVVVGGGGGFCGGRWREEEFFGLLLSWGNFVEGFIICCSLIIVCRYIFCVGGREIGGSFV